MTNTPTIWQRIEEGLAQAPVQATKQTDQRQSFSQSMQELGSDWRQLRRYFRWFDLLVVSLWLYALTKVFVFDVDRKLLDAIDHGAPKYLDYRIFLYLALLVILVIWQRKWSLLFIAYIVFFPVIVVFWKIPVFFIRRRSFPLFMASAQGFVNFVRGFRYHVITKGLAAFAVLFILISSSSGLLAVSASYLAVLTLWSYVRLFRKTFSSSTFLDAQRQAINRILKSKRLTAIATPGPEYQTTDTEPYDYNTATQLAATASIAIIIDRFLYVWAYHLDRYRRQVSPALTFNGLSFIWLLLGTIFSLSFVNEALLKIDPSQFNSEGHHASLLAITLYSFASLFLQEAGGVHAIGDAAQALQLVAAFLGLGVVSGAFLNIVTTARRERGESELRELIAMLKQRARDVEDNFRADYSVSVEDAHRRLVELKAGLAFVFSYLTSMLPEDFLSTPDRTR